MRPFPVALVFGGLVLAAAAAPARACLVERALRIHGEPTRYAVWEPPGCDRSRLWPCVVFLHGSGESGRDPLAPTRVGLGPQILAHPERWPCLVVFPQKPNDTEEWEERETLVLAVLADVRKHWKVDADRIALTGMSQGGHGAWMLAARQPGLWSAVAPVCGYGRARTVASRIGDLPVWAFHGLRDDQVLPKDARDITAELRRRRAAAGIDTGTVKLTLYAGANHDSWDSAYAEPELPGWLLAQRRKREGR